MTTTQTFNLLEPYEIAEETFVVPWALEAPRMGHFPMNSMVIRGAEPILVDTGAPAVRGPWLDAVWSLVDPLDVRWVFLTHDDRDHSGNLLPILAACPNATLLTTWFSIGRMAEEWETPIERCRFVNDGDTIDAGDRTLVAVRPPLFDNPTTRALFDLELPAVQPCGPGCDESAAEELAVAEIVVGQFPDRCERLGAEVIAGCHTPVLRGPRVAEAFDLLHRLPDVEPWQEFTQTDLDSWMAAAEASARSAQQGPRSG
jgi:Metallo-beta-lactamase superfamily